jgi:hypothetical protein
VAANPAIQVRDPSRQYEAVGALMVARRAVGEAAGHNRSRRREVQGVEPARRQGADEVRLVGSRRVQHELGRGEVEANGDAVDGRAWARPRR